jgi:S1-C subfamily serine protease
MKYLVAVFVLLAVLAGPAACPATDFSSIFEGNKNSVVTIKAGKSLGTGFYVTPNLIVTNIHVIRNSSDVSFSSAYNEGFSQVHHIVATDDAHDLAVLYAEKTGPPVTLAESKGLVPGMELVCIGSPQGYEKTFTSGNFSQMRQNGLMQISIPVSPGSSGSPVFDVNGRVVGVVVAQRKEAQNINFAIPSEFVLALLQKSEALHKHEYVEVATFHAAHQDSGGTTGPESLMKDYVNIDMQRDGCRNFSSTYFESPKRGPIKKCICNDRLIYTNLICQCPACRK